MKKILSIVLIFFFIYGLFAAVFSSVSATNLIEDSWSTKTPMNYRRNGFEIVAVNGQIYVIGGYTGDSPYESKREDFKGINERYDPVTDTWTTLKSMPTLRYNFAIAECQGKIYCMGGGQYVEPGMVNRCDVNEVYDVATDSWSIKAAMPFKAGGIHAQVVNGKIFVINCNAMFMYDPETDVWTTKPEVPLFLMPPVSTVVAGKIMLTGNFPGIDYTPKVMFYDPKTDKWSDIKTGTIAASDHAVVASHGTPEMYQGTLMGTIVTNGHAVAAEATSGIYAPKNVYVFFEPDDTLVYNPENNIWSTVKTPPVPLSGHKTAVINDILYAIGDTETMQYIPIGYHGNAPNTPNYTTPLGPSDDLTSLGPSDNPQIIVLNASIVIALIILAMVLSMSIGVIIILKRR